MTKRQVEEMFKNEVMPYIYSKEKEYGNGIDIPMRSEAWNDYTDMLCKDRMITDHQYNNWSHPAICH